MWVYNGSEVMKNIIAIFAALVFAGSALAVAPKCPKCHMTLSMHKSKAMPMAVKIKGKTYYCCAACGAHKMMSKAPVKTAPTSH